MLTLTPAFLREARRKKPNTTILVQVADYAGGKFVWAERNVLGIPASVKSIDSRTSEIDPLECRQSLSSGTIELVDDGLVRKLVENNAIVGKTLTMKLGFDTGSDATFLESDYAGFAGGIIDGYEFVAGGVTIRVKDLRSLIWEREGTGNGKGVSRKVPQEAAADGEPEPVAITGSAHVAIRTLLEEAGVPPALYHADSFLPDNHLANGHLVVYRDRYGANSDRRLKEPTPVNELVDEIAKILRAYVLVQEDGKAVLKSFNGSAAAVDRFTEEDIRKGTARCGIQFGQVVTSVFIRSMWNGYTSNDLAGGYRFRYRDDDAGAQVEWGTEDGDARKADWQVDDRWFCSSCGNWQNQVIPVGAATLHLSGTNFSGNTAATGAPLAVSAERPGYLWIMGAGGKDASGGIDNGEVVKFESVADHTVNGYTHKDISTLTHAQFGTVDQGHAVSSGPGSGQLLWDITPLVYASDQVLGRFAEGAATLEFETGLHKYGVQLTDIVHIETPIFIRKGLNGLAVGNTIPFEVVKKDVDIVNGVIQWKFVEVREKDRTSVFSGGAWKDIANVPIPGLFHDSDQVADLRSVAGLFNASAASLVRTTWINGKTPALPNPASLDLTIPEQALSTASHGIVSAPRKAFSFTAERDVYVDFDPQDGEAGHWEYQEVANGAGAPAVPTGFERAFKIVTDATGITSIERLGATALVDLDANVKDGATFGRTKNAALTDGQVDLAKAGVINKTADNIDETAGRKWAAESGADVTALHKAADAFTADHADTASAADLAAAIVGQGALATKDTIGTADVDNLAVTEAKLAHGSVAPRKLKDGRLHTNLRDVLKVGGLTFTAAVEEPAADAFVSVGEDASGLIAYRDGVQVFTSAADDYAARYGWIDTDASASFVQTSDTTPPSNPDPSKILMLWAMDADPAEATGVSWEPTNVGEAIAARVRASTVQADLVEPNAPATDADLELRSKGSGDIRLDAGPSGKVEIGNGGDGIVNLRFFSLIFDPPSVPANGVATHFETVPGIDTSRDRVVGFCLSSSFGHANVHLQQIYTSAANQLGFVFGNSSSGAINPPSLGIQLIVARKL